MEESGATGIALAVEPKIGERWIAGGHAMVIKIKGGNYGTPKF
jgi:hypothetical protein